ncbi:MAG: hypothetical protein VCC04_10475 [Myxococcota bacterium]
MSDERTPVIVGVGQLVQHDLDRREALEPLDMLEKVSRLEGNALASRGKNRLRADLSRPHTHERPESSGPAVRLAVHGQAASRAVAFVPKN